MKTTISLLILFFVVLGGGYLYSTHQGGSTTPSVSNTTETNTPADTGTVTTTSTTTTTQTNTGTGTANPSSYTLAQVGTHTSSKSCWTAINGNVYNLTTWISQHPGGQSRILSICGKDGSSAFDGQHGGDPRALSILAGFKIGSLAP